MAVSTSDGIDASNYLLFHSATENGEYTQHDMVAWAPSIDIAAQLTIEQAGWYYIVEQTENEEGLHNSAPSAKFPSQ
jgi:hypothetical protein